jgi:hypothetical protein
MAGERGIVNTTKGVFFSDFRCFCVCFLVYGLPLGEKLYPERKTGEKNLMVEGGDFCGK